MTETSLQRLGILGGTFDPIHIGHLAAAAAAIECARLDRVVVVPAGKPPHRAGAIAAAEDRLEMCRLATADDPRFEVSEIETKRKGPSYTVDTLLELRRTRSDDELFLILGWDAASLFRTWHQPDRVRDLATIVVVARPGSKAPQPGDLALAGIDPARAVVCLRSTPNLSASEIRRAVAAGQPISGKVPSAVERFITTRRMYLG